MLKKVFTVAKLLMIAFVTVFFAVAVMLAMLIAGKKVFHKFARIWSKVLLFIAGLKLRINNENLEFPMRNVVYISNHSSLFDIPVLLASLNDNARIMYKEELEKIPVFGWCLKMSPFLSVKREDPAQAMQSFRDAVKSISTGDSVIIFPEGTRSEDGNLGQFKKGAFLLASKSGKEIVPIVINGTAEVMPKSRFSINPRTIQIILLKKISYDAIKATKIESLIENIHALILNNLNKKSV